MGIRPPGVESVSSTSSDSTTQIQVTYVEDTDLDIAATKLREEFDMLSLPDGATDPVIVNINISELMPSAIIALMGDDISNIPYLKRLSNATVKTIKLSITLSMCINFFAIIASLLELLNPTTGALVHNAGSCFVVLIAALLYDRKFE